MVIASTINMLSTPIGAAIQPRMTYLLANGDEVAMLAIYRSATQLATLSVMTIAITIAMFSEPLVYAWTGNQEIATWSNQILFWFSLSNGILAIIIFQYYLQVAHGRLRLHIFGSSISALIEIPIIVYIAINYGALGVGIAWFVMRVMWLFFWVPLVHHKFTPGLHWDWFFKDVLLISATIFSISLLLHNFIIIDFHSGRVEIFLQLIAIGLFTLSLSSIGSSFLRGWVVEKIRNLYASA
jgi:O-antigen/teichoic acid export membrane protein